MVPAVVEAAFSCGFPRFGKRLGALVVVPDEAVDAAFGAALPKEKPPDCVGDFTVAEAGGSEAFAKLKPDCG